MDKILYAILNIVGAVLMVALFTVLILIIAGSL